MRVVDLQAAAAPDDFGAKAARLRWLADRGYPVPRAWVVVADDTGATGRLLVDVVTPGARYAVRSSANLEDGADFSFAGQFLTELDVAAGDVAAAASRVRDSASGERVGRYLASAGLEAADVEMGVIVQEMISAVVSGVVFSRNPMTGLSETIIEAVAGRGDALVGEGVTPQRWVYRWGDRVAAPADPLLAEPTVTEIVRVAAAIEAEFGAPVDLEWVWDGEMIHWLQLRAITGLEAVDVYSNRIAREVLPGIIKPLVWTVNVPLVNSAWIDLFTEAIGPNDLEPADLARAFAYRAYFNMGTIGRIFEELGMPRETLELLLGFEGSRQPTFKPTRHTLPHLPRMIAAGARKLRYGRRVEALLPQLDEALRGFAAAPIAEMDDATILADVDRLFEVVRRLAYVNIVVPLLMNAYYGGLRRRLGKQHVDITRVDLTEGAPIAGDYDPARALDALHERFGALPGDEQASIGAGGYAAIRDPGFRDDVDRFLARFGHFSDSGNDFSAVPWREDPDHVVRLVADHRPALADGTRLGWSDLAASTGALSRLVLRGWFRRARDYRSYRDAVSFQYTRGYGLFRDRFFELGRRLAARELLASSDDIWYLELGEVRSLVAGDPLDGRARATERRAEIAAMTDVALPEVIFGEEFVPAPPPERIGGVLEGIPTSRGVHRGPLRVVLGRDGFGDVMPGDILVVPFSDVGWTPLFARAGAVVAEAGGMLSHSSIVAREFGIPCVVSVPDACRLPSGVTAVVDGYAGTVTLERP